MSRTYLTIACIAMILGACAQRDRLAVLAERPPECSPLVLSEANDRLASKDIPVRFSSEPFSVDIDRLWFSSQDRVSLIRSCIAPSIITNHGVAFPLVNEDEADTVGGFFVVAVGKDDPRVLRLQQMTATEQEFRSGVLQAAYQVYSGRDYRFPRIESVGTIQVEDQTVPIVRGLGFDTHTIRGVGGFQVRVYATEVALALIELEKEFILIGTPFISYWARRDETPIDPLYTAPELLRMIISRLEVV